MDVCVVCVCVLYSREKRQARATRKKGQRKETKMGKEGKVKYKTKKNSHCDFEIFRWFNSSGCTVVLEYIQPVT
jgi:hypothetical protein